MIWEFPKLIESLVIERALGPEAVQKYESGRLPSAMLQKAAEALGTTSQTFTSQRGQISHHYLANPDVRAAYLLYYLAANLPKVCSVFDELNSHPAGLLNKEEIRVLDLGAGVGTASLGLIWYLGQSAPTVKRITITAIDNTGTALGDCRWLVERLALALNETGSGLVVELKTEQTDLLKYQPGTDAAYDLIMVSNSLNELYPRETSPIEKRTEWLNLIGLKSLAANGSLIVIEPASSGVAREFHQVRDRLLELAWHIFSPCVAGRPCPMLNRERDWCHQTLNWNRPLIVRQLDEMIGNRKEALKFSYAVFRRDDLKLTDKFSGYANIYRAVGDLQKEKGKDSIYLCGESGALPHVLLKRHRNSGNNAFISIRRYDLAAIETEGGEATERIGPNDGITILSRGNRPFSESNLAEFREFETSELVERSSED